MKKIFTLIFALCAFAGVANAQIEGIRIGYCDGQVNTLTNPNFKVSEKNVWISAAIYIPAEDLGVYAGNHIDMIRAGLVGNLQIDSLKVWVRTDLNGEDLASGTIVKTSNPPVLVKGWNNVSFDEPYQITENPQGVYLGYSFHQKSSTNGLSILSTPHANALFVDLATGEWQDRSSEGTLSIEGVISGDLLPQINLSLDDIQVPKCYAINMGKLDVTAIVTNKALKRITGYQAICNIEGYDNPLVADIADPIYFEETRQVKFTIEPTMITTIPEGPLNITVTLANINEGEDENMEDNTKTASFNVIEKAFKRGVLVEEFTTEKCVYCPPAATMLHQTLAKPQYSDAFMMEHHSGYYTDFMTTSFDQSYTWFYNDGGSTYCPAMMVDRTEFSNENTPVFGASQALLEDRIDQRLADLALVGVDIQAGYLEDGKLGVIVTGERVIKDITSNPARITVFLIEDNIAAQNQSGASSGFIHHNVGRAVNSTWGTVIQWDGNKYKYEYSFNVPDSYVKDNLGIIAIVSDYKSSDPNACAIVNAAILRAADFGFEPEEPDYVLHYGLNEENAEWQDVTFVAGEGENEGKLIAANVEFAANTEFKVNYGDVWYGGGTEDSYYLIHSEWFENIALDAEGKNFHINEAGTYTFVLDVTEEGVKMTVTGWPEPQEPDYVLHYGYEGVEWQDATFVPGEGENEGKLVVADLAFEANTEFGVKYGETWFAGLPNEGEDNYVIHYGWCTDIPLSTGDNVKNFLINEAGTYTFLLTVGEEGNTLSVTGLTAPALPGDANGDSQVDISDVNSVINQMLGKEDMIPACDMNGDGIIDISDVNAVINKMLGK